MKRVLALFLVLICMLSLVACDKATGSGEPVRGGDVSDMPEIDPLTPAIYVRLLLPDIQCPGILSVCSGNCQSPVPQRRFPHC